MRKRTAQRARGSSSQGHRPWNVVRQNNDRPDGLTIRFHCVAFEPWEPNGWAERDLKTITTRADGPG